VRGAEGTLATVAFAHPLINAKFKMQNAKLKTLGAQKGDAPAFRAPRLALCILEIRILYFES
jgi:hypothetical protein